jgi:hypothetical protein
MTKRGIKVDAFKTSTRAAKIDLINSLQSALDENRQVIGENIVKDDSGFEIRHPVLEGPGEGSWGLLRLPCIGQLMDEMGIYSIDDKNIALTDSVISLALVTDLARDMEGLRAPLIGGLYWSPEQEAKSVSRAALERISTVRIPLGVSGEILGGSNG